MNLSAIKNLNWSLLKRVNVDLVWKGLMLILAWKILGTLREIDSSIYSMDRSAYANTQILKEEIQTISRDVSIDMRELKEALQRSRY